MSTPNWGKLYREGRCKEIGVPWSAEEFVALHELEIPAEYVRDGILTTEEYEKASELDAKKGTPLSRMTRQELLEKTTELEISGFTSVTTDSALREMISRADKPKAKPKVEKPKAKPKAKKAVTKKKK